MFTSIDLSHKNLIDSYLSQEYITSSELNFTTLYIWKEAFGFAFCEVEGCLVIYSKNLDNPPAVRFPIGNGDKKKAIEIVSNYFLENGFKPQFIGVTENEKMLFEKLFPEKLAITASRDYADYLYKTESLITLSGKALHNKKNHLNSFLKNYSYKYEKLTKDDKDEIATEYSSWLKKRGNEQDYYLKSEFESICSVIDNLDKLNCIGAKLYADGKLCAFTIGEALNRDTAVIHIEKANTDINGSYAAINQMFLQNEWKDFEFVNREEDCGIEGLRKAKLSYKPYKLIDKYRVVFK